MSDLPEELPPPEPPVPVDPLPEPVRDDPGANTGDEEPPLDPPDL